MKYVEKKISYFFLIILLVVSCQGEIDIDEGENPNTNNYNSEITNYYQRIGMHDGSFDDIIDRNSCSSIILPVSLSANGVPLHIKGIPDYQLVIDIFNQSELDEDIITFNFPITIVNKDYTETVISNLQQFENLHSTCNEAIINNLNPITCIDIQYPIKISLFNTVLEKSTIIDINNNHELFSFMNNLSEDEVYSIQYPITILPVEQNSLTINSDDELKTLINNCIDNTTGQNQIFDLNNTLNNGIWKISSFMDKNTDLTSTFTDYNLDFNEDFTLIANYALTPTLSIDGTWKTSYINNITTLILDFNNDINFEILSREWEVTAATSSQVNLKFHNEAYLILITL